MAIDANDRPIMAKGGRPYPLYCAEQGPQTDYCRLRGAGVNSHNSWGPASACMHDSTAFYLLLYLYSFLFYVCTRQAGYIHYMKAFLSFFVWGATHGSH